MYLATLPVPHPAFSCLLLYQAMGPGFQWEVRVLLPPAADATNRCPTRVSGKLKPSPSSGPGLTSCIWWDTVSLWVSFPHFPIEAHASQFVLGWSFRQWGSSHPSDPDLWARQSILARADASHVMTQISTDLNACYSKHIGEYPILAELNMDQHRSRR